MRSSYYAGPAVPAGASHAIQIADTAPVTWTKITRNVLRDAQQALGFYLDSVGTNSPGSPPSQGPRPDDVQWTGYQPSGVDGSFLLIDDLRLESLPIDWENYAHPTSQGDTTAAYDFTAKYPDGTTHYFNQQGLLTRITDRDGNAITLNYTVTRNVAGPAAYALTSISAPTDGTSSSGVTYRRQIGVASSGTNPRVVTFTELLGTTTNPVTGRSTSFSMAGADDPGGTYTTNDVIQIKPARVPSCTGSPNGCVGFAYTSADAHQLSSVVDPRYTTSPANNYAFDIAWTGASPMTITDRSQGSAVVLRVLNYAVTPSVPASYRVLWQDGADLEGDTASYTDLSNEGSPLYEYIPLPCTGTPPACGAPTGLSTTDIAVSHQFDGLAQINTTTTYRCPAASVSGSACSGTASELVSRQATKAAAKVDNFADPLTAGEVAWSQSPDQFYRSMADSNGDNPDLYRTTYAYDNLGNQISSTSPTYDATPSYANTILSTTRAGTALKGYWRLNETSGTTAVDSAASPHNGTYNNSVTLGQAGALVNDASNKAATFNGSNNDVTIPSSLGTINGSFTVEAWILTSTDTKTASREALIGSRSGSDFSFDAKLCNNFGTDCPGSQAIRIDVGSGTGWLATGNLPFQWAANTWYQVAVDRQPNLPFQWRRGNSYCGIMPLH